MNNMPEKRRKKIKNILKRKGFVRAMEASNGLSGIIVENTKYRNKEYDAMWISSLCDSTFKGKKDNEVVDFSSRIATINEILEVTTKPIIVDGDTGGKIEHFIENVRTLERLGVSAVVIEDKKGLKQNSLLGNDAVQTLEDVDVFSEKIRAGKKALRTKDFLIVARIESFIAGSTLEDALVRARSYVSAGADAIMIHSYKKDGCEIMDFLSVFKSEYPNIPVVLVPTTYNHFSEEELRSKGANIIIYANHLLRSAYKYMSLTAKEILKDESSFNVSRDLCVSMKDILSLIGDDND